MKSTSEQGEKVAQRGYREVENADNPFNLVSGVNKLDKIREKRNELCKRHNLREPAIDVLIKIGSRLLNGKINTLYAISMPTKGSITNNNYKTRRLLESGLLEIVGTGERNSNNYAPSVLGQALLNELASVL